MQTFIYLSTQNYVRAENTGLHNILLEEAWKYNCNHRNFAWNVSHLKVFSKSCYNMISPVVYVVKVEQQNDVVTRYTPLQSIVSINLQLSI